MTGSKGLSALSKVARFFYQVGLFSLVGGTVIGVSVLLLWSLTSLIGVPHTGPTWYI